MENPYRYAGYRYDEVTGLYYLQSRYYNPETGRFLTRDSFEGKERVPLTQNLYAYVQNNPVVYIDPNGNVRVKSWKKGRIVILSPSETSKLLLAIKWFRKYGTVAVGILVAVLTRNIAISAGVTRVLKIMTWVFDGIISYANRKGKGIKIYLRRTWKVYYPVSVRSR